MTELQAKIINNRISQEEIKELYNNDITNVLNPIKYFDILKDIEQIPDIKQAAELIITHIKKESLIVSLGDIDTDGCTASYITYKMLIELFGVKKENIRVVVGTREQGRGITDVLIEKIHYLEEKNKRKIGLLILSDHGSTDELKFQELKKYNPTLDILLTDHHQIEYDNYPSTANVFVNTQRNDTAYTKTICGCMTIFLVLFYTYHKYYKKTINDVLSYVPYVAIATIVDMMSMKTPINRYIIQLGLQELAKTQDKKLIILKTILNLQETVTFRDISISIGPYINTANRFGIEELLMLGLISDDDEKILKIFNYLFSLNTIRKNITEDSIIEAYNSIDINKYSSSAVCIIQPNKFRANINGVVAATIGQMTKTPCICFTKNNNKTIAGSCRVDLPGFNLLKILKDIQNKYPNIVISAHGHKSACGVQIYKNKINEFKDILNQKSEVVLKTLEVKPVEYEFFLEPYELNLTTAIDVMQVGPFGIDYEIPIFTTTPLTVVSVTPIRTFYKIIFKNSIDEKILAMHFFRYSNDDIANRINFLDVIKPGMNVNVLFTLELDTYNTKSNFMLNIVSIKPTILS